MAYDVIVIGAGAAGLMAAGTAAMSGRSVLLMEKMEKAGRKIRITLFLFFATKEKEIFRLKDFNFNKPLTKKFKYS